MSERLLQDIRDYEAEPRTPMVGCFVAEVNLHGVRVQSRVCCSTRQREGIDVGAYDEVSASSPGDSDEQPRTRSDVQHRFWLLLPA